MKRWIVQLDDVLRGKATGMGSLRDGRIPVEVGGLTAVLALLGCIYGFAMGWFALFNRSDPQYMQVIASTVKVPMLFLLTLLVTFPSLYVFNALMGSRLALSSLVQLLVVAMAVTLAVLASFAPIVAFFSLTTTSYSFIVLFHVLVFGVAGLLGLAFLLQTLHRLTLTTTGAWPAPIVTAPSLPSVSNESIDPPPGDVVIEPSPEAPAGALDPVEGHVLGRHEKAVFRLWILVFGVVGAQMSWVLRPFIGSPHRSFEWFRPRESNFFEAVFQNLQRLLHG